MFDPSIGRWMQEDPEMYIDGPNMYEFEGSNPTDSLDPAGTKHGRLHNFNDGFSDDDKKKIEASLERIRVRSISLLKEIDDEMAAEKCGKCYDKLAQLRKIVDKVRDNLDPDYHDFLGDGGAFDFWSVKGSDVGHNKDAVLWWESQTLGINIYFNNEAQTPWNKLKDSDLDQRLFHELTHEFGTDDGEANDDFNNAHLVENLMNEPLDKWVVLNFCKKQNK